MSDFNYCLQESLCIFAQSIQSFLDRGWRIVDIKYGEEKFDIKTVLIAEKNGERRMFSPDEMEYWVRDNANTGEIKL